MESPTRLGSNGSTLEKRHSAIEPGLLSGRPRVSPRSNESELRARPVGTPGSAQALPVYIIDVNQFSQECIARALGGLGREPAVQGFRDVAECVGRTETPPELIIYHAHEVDFTNGGILRNVSALREAFAGAGIVVMSAAAADAETIRSIIRQGARGFIPTRMTSINVLIETIRLVQAGGTFAPLDLLLPVRQEIKPKADGCLYSLTARQIAVLRHVQQGKANKIIAHELGMSESTVKVHVRNIMRKMGATNRTQAAFMAQNHAHFATTGRDPN